MTFLNKKSLQIIKEYFEDDTLYMVVKKEWGRKNNSDYRSVIHDDLFKKHQRNSSISHSETVGGYIYSEKKDMFVGFDIEQKSRITEPVVRRICLTEEEFEQAPSAASLWVAKEASFKSLRELQQPSVVSKIKIGQWQSFAADRGHSQYETCHIINTKELKISVAKGIIFYQDDLVFCFFSSKP